MKLKFLNENVPGVKFEVRWGENDRTPAYQLEPGAAGVLDLDDYGVIPEGARLSVYTWQESTGLANRTPQDFKYVKGKKVDGTFKIAKVEANLVVAYIGGQAA